MSRVIGVFSGKGGVGKTTLVANLGSALTTVFKKNVVIFDNNIHASHLGLHFGLYEDIPVTLREVLKQHMPIIHAVYIHPTIGVRLIPAPLNGVDIALTKEKCSSLVKQVKENYDLVILDCAPGLGKEVVNSMYSIEDAILISTPDIPSLTDAIKTIEILKKLKKNVLGIVINRYRNQKYELTPQEISSTTNYNVLATIPEDEKVPNSISKGMPVVISFPYSKASIAFKKLAASLVNESYTGEGIWEKLKNIFHLPSFKPSKEVQPIVQQQLIRKEISDVAAMKSELMKEFKEELKSKIKERVRKKLEERIRGE